MSTEPTNYDMANLQAWVSDHVFINGNNPCKLWDSIDSCDIPLGPTYYPEYWTYPNRTIFHYPDTWVYPVDGSPPYKLDLNKPSEADKTPTSWKCVQCNKIWAPHIDFCKTCSP